MRILRRLGGIAIAALGYLRFGDTLVVIKLDRLGRSVKNLKMIADDLEFRGVNLHAITQGIDTMTPGRRLFFHMLAAIAEFEHDLIVERTMEGLASARARGREGGGKFEMTRAKAKQARSMYDSHEYTVDTIAQTLGVSRATIYRCLAKDGDNETSASAQASEPGARVHRAAAVQSESAE